MKIAVNTENVELYNEFYKVCKEKDHQVINVKVEKTLFDIIEVGDIDAYILSNSSPYFKKAVDFIKKNSPYTPIIGLIESELTWNIQADFYLEFPMKFEGVSALVVLSQNILHTLNTYTKTFATLQKLTAKMHDKIEFGNCSYDPTRRMLSHKGKEIKKLSAKEGGILEILASHYGEVVKKEIILEKVWRKNDYFAGRSMDVYITYIRNTFKDNKIKLTIKNISGIGLILE